MALSPNTRLGPYEIAGSIGAGGMGEVYRARDTRLGREVALKVLPDLFASDPERVARFEREARTLASLNHPNIAAVYGFEQIGDVRALALELVEGPTLADRVAQGRVPLDEVLAITRQVADALEAAHEQGIVHRDLKPANIKVRPDGSVKVLDFGLAKAFQTDAAGVSGSVSMSPTITSPAMTARGVIMGTAAYMAPEQAKGRPVGKRADVWALGCVVFEMLTGRRPFEGDDMTEVLAAVIKSDPDWTALPADTPAAVLRLLKGCLAKDPRQRVADAAVVRYALDEPTVAQAASPAPASRRSRWPVVAAATLAATLVAAAVWGASRMMRPVPQPVRLAVVPSPGQSVFPAGVDRDLVITPDGQRLVYRATVSGTPKLVVRDLNQLEGRVLDGTDNARAPFISPDGQWVAFFAAGALKKVALTGGASLTLCSYAGSSRGGSWEGDTIVFASGDPATGLLRVPAAGGEPTVLTVPDTAAGESDHVLPAFADADHVLFTVTSTGESAAVAALNLRTNERTTVVRGGGQAQYLTSGVLLFAQNGTLRAARFDVSRMALSSEPVPVLERVSTDTGGSADYTVSRDGLLVYVPGALAQQTKRLLVWVTPHGRHEPLPVDGRAFADPRVGPDDRQVAVEIADTADDVWTLDAARGTVTRQSFEPGEDETALWMPDGRTLVYSSTRAGTSRAVYRRRADGVGGEEALWSGQGHVHVEALTPDGRSLIVSSAAVNGGQMDLMLLPLEGDRAFKPLLQTPFSEFGARLSPDGRFMAYTSNESGRSEVYIRAFPSLEGKTQVSTDGGTQPVWSRRGGELYFMTAEEALAVPVQTTGGLSVGQPRKLFENRYYLKGATHTSYDVAGDGRFLMVQEDPGTAGGAPSVNLQVVLHWFEELEAKLP